MLSRRLYRGFGRLVVHTLDRWARNVKVSIEAASILGKNNVGLVSIAEAVDYSTPQGKLFMGMLSVFAQYFSEALGAHVSKSMSQRAFEGKLPAVSLSGMSPVGLMARRVRGNGAVTLSTQDLFIRTAPKVLLPGSSLNVIIQGLPRPDGSPPG